MALGPLERELLKGFLRGERTWAEVEGITADQARAWARLGVDLADAGRLRESMLVFEALVAMNPKDAGAQAALGTVYQRLGRSTDALAAYSEAISLDARNAVALANRGELLLRAGQRVGYADLAAAVEADPEGRTAAGRRAARIARAVTLAAAKQLELAVRS